MQIHVYTDHINIYVKSITNTGEFQANEISFEFESAYNGLVKKAIFTDENDTAYEVLITNNKCYIPIEVVQKPGKVKLGIYGYKAENDELVLRYSPQVSYFSVTEGSYRSDTENSTNPTPTDLEQLTQAVATLEQDIDDLSDSLNDNYYTKSDVDDLIESAYTTVMGGEY